MASARETGGTSHADDKETQAEVLDLPPHGFHLFIEANSADTSEADFNNLCERLKNNSYDSVGGVAEIQPHGTKGAFVKFEAKPLSIDAIRKLNKEKMIGVHSLLWKNNKLRIWNVPHNWTKDELKTAMREQIDRDNNGVLSVQFMTEGYSDRKTAIILFCNKSCAEEAMRKMSKPGIKLGAHAPIVNWENHEDFVVWYTIKDKESYIQFITELREKLVSSSDVVDYIFERDRAYPVIGKKAGWIFIELNAEDGENGRTTTLAIWNQNLYVLGFRTQEHGWFELGKSDKTLPKEYDAKKLGWGVSYTSIMKLNFGDQVEKTLRSTRLGKAFAERAVRRLARYSELVKNNDDRPTRLGLAGLIVMICEAARMNPFLDTFAGGWNEGTGLTTRLAGIMWDWGSMSAALLEWKYSGYSKWPVRCKHRLDHALASVHLVLNSNEIKSCDPAWVEICGVEFPPDFDATGITITVFDEGNHSHIIYKQGKREYQKEVISVYEWFRIRVERPGVIITKEWDCLNPEGGYATGPDARAIFLDHSTRILVTYMVMTDAIKANVEVKMWAPPEYSSPTCARGKIAARIDGFDEIELFNSQTLLTRPPRSDVRVPHGKRLHITTEGLAITDASGKDIKIPDDTLTSDSSSSPSVKVIDSVSAADCTLQLIVTWDTHQDKTIEGHLTCDMGVKEEYANTSDNLKFSCGMPTFPTPYVHIELQVGAPDEKSSTILAVQLFGDGVGFMNESGVWYGGSCPVLSRGEYNVVLLGWGNNYKDILQASDWDDDFMDKLNPAKLTVEGFAKAAVRTLSRYPDVDVEEGDMNPRVALVGLMIMFRESTEWEAFSDFFVKGWSGTMKFTPEMTGYIKKKEGNSFTLRRKKETALH